MANTSLIIGDNNWAVKEDNLLGYNVIQNKYVPIEMDVVRATTATRVNSDGLIEVVPYNLLTYSNTFSNASWFKNNTTITTSQAGYDETNNASLLVENSTASTHFIGKTPSLSGQITISVYAKANTRNWLYLRGVQAGVPVFGWFNLSDGTLGTIQTNGTGSIESVGNGWYRCSLTIANFNTGFETYIGISTANNTISYLGNESSVFIQNAQVNSGASAKEYFPTTDRLNVPRLDYTNGGCPSILVEPQRTNLASYSEQFDNAYWTKASGSTPVITQNSILSPSGMITADTITPNNTLANHWLGKIGFSLTSGITYSYSVFAKNNGYNLVLSVGSSTIYTNCNFNLSNGTTSTPYNSAGANLCVPSIVDYGNGWYRCIITFTAWATSNVLLFSANNTTTTPTGAFGMINMSGNGVDGFYLWGAQLEAGSYATSYIPTTSASVTRNADVISKTGISNLIGQTEGTLFVDVNYKAESVSKNYLNLGTSTSNYIAIGARSNNKIGMEVLNSGVQVNAPSTDTYLTSQRLKIAMTYKLNDFKLYVNGILQATDTSGTVPTKAEVYLGSYGNGTFQATDGINSAQLYKTALTDQECINLTTL